MKKFLIILIASIFTLSCTNKLSESKVEEELNECLKNDPIYGKSIIVSGIVSNISFDKIKIYRELERLGFIKIEKKIFSSKWILSRYNLITITNKAKPFIIDTKDYGEYKSNYIRLYSYKLDKIGSIQEIPSLNTAEVTVTYKKDLKTPLYDIFETDKTDFITKKINFNKTENQGWIYCEK
jgi:hypothetical protein